MRKNYILIVFSIALYCTLTGLVWYAIPSEKTRFEVDSPAYIAPVERFEQVGSFTNSSQVTNMMSLGYPFFLVVVRAILGQSYNAIIIVQLFLALLCLYFMYSLSYLLFSRSVALLALVFASFNLSLIMYPHYFLTEILTCFLFIVALERFCIFYYHDDHYALSLSALFFGFSLVVKGAVLFYIPLLLLFIVIKSYSNIRCCSKSLLLFSIWISLAPGVYSIRNHQIYGNYFFQTLTHVNIYWFFLLNVIRYEENCSAEQAGIKVAAINRNVCEFGSGKGWEEGKAYFLSKCFSSPCVVAYVWGRNVIKTYCGFFCNQLRKLLFISHLNNVCSFFMFSGPWYQKLWSYITFNNTPLWFIVLEIIELLCMALRYLLVLLAFVFLIKKRKWFILSILGSWIVYFSCITGFDGCCRYRTMIELELTILAALGCGVIGNQLRHKKIKLLTEL